MKYSLFIGRWSPWHSGHQALVENVLREGKNVCIAIRDTEISETDPYTVDERATIIYRAMSRWGNRVRLITIPDITEIVFGRKVGWNIREIRLDDETEAISATAIRQQTRNIHG